MRTDLVLVVFSADYADEFDVRGSKVMSQSEYDAMLERLIARAEENAVELWFGTNEYVEFNSESDVRRAYNAVEITEAQAAFINSLPNAALGTFLS